MIYLDHSATSFLKPPEVPRAMLRAMKESTGVGRGGHSLAMRAAEVVHQCRMEGAALFDAEAEQVVFTMNATHGLNIAIRSLCKPGMHVAISGFEHNGVLRPLHALGATITVCGRELFRQDLAVEEFKQALDSGAELVVCTCCSNVFGYILPIDRIAELCRRRNVPLIIDGSQGAGILPLSLKKLGAAFIAFPGHKALYGPQGTGILLCGCPGEPLLYGGTGSRSMERDMPEDLPDRLEAGTHNVCGIAGLLEGIRYVRRLGTDRILNRERKLMGMAAKGLGEIRGVRLYRGKEQSGVLSFTVKGRDPEDIAQELAKNGVAVRAGLHCAPLAHESGGTAPSGTIRISTSERNREQEMTQFIRICKKIF